MLSDDMLRFVFVYDARFADALPVEAYGIYGQKTLTRTPYLTLSLPDLNCTVTLIAALP